MKDIKRISKKSSTKKSSSMSVISKQTSARVDQHGKTRFLEMASMVNSDC